MDDMLRPERDDVAWLRECDCLLEPPAEVTTRRFSFSESITATIKDNTIKRRILLLSLCRIGIGEDKGENRWPPRRKEGRKVAEGLNRSIPLRLTLATQN